MSRTAALGRLLLSACAFLAAGVLQTPAAAGEEFVGHMALLEQLGREAARDALEGLDLKPGTAVYLVPESPHPANWLIARVLERELVARGMTVHATAFGREGGAPPQAAAGAGTPGAGNGARQGRASMAQQAESPTSAVGEGEISEDTGDAEEGEEGEEGDGDEPEEGEDREDGEDAEEDDAAGSEGEEPQQQEPAAQEGVPSSQPADATPSGDGGGGAAAVESAGFELRLPPRGEVVAFRVIECGVRYPWTRRAMLVGQRHYGRMAGVKLWTTHLSQPGRIIRGSAPGERVHFDSFPGWAKPMVEGAGYPFPLEDPQFSSLAGWVEPVAVAGIVSGLVYLFVQNQK